MKKSKEILKTIVKISLALYILLITWIIVFKFRIDITSLKYIRSINLIPFKTNGAINGMKETLVNLILFIPFGMYLEYLFKDKRKLNIIIIILTSFCYEIMQYIFHIGVSDITDIIMNTLGGIIGILLIYMYFYLINKIKNNKIYKNLLEILLIIIPTLILAMLFLI